MAVVVLRGGREGGGGVFQNKRRRRQRARLNNHQQNLQHPLPRTEISRQTARDENAGYEGRYADRGQDEARRRVRTMAGTGSSSRCRRRRKSRGQLDRVPRLARSEAHEILQEDDVLEADGEGLQEELEFREVVDGERC